MSTYLLIKLLACALSLSLGTYVLSRASGLVVNRLIACILLAASHWCFCEMMWNAQADAEGAVAWMRFSALGWMWLGPMGFHISVEMLGDLARGLRRLVPAFYAASVAGAMVYLATPWAVAGAAPTAWGWAPIFSGVPSALSLVPSTLPAAVSLVCWRRVHRLSDSQGERWRSNVFFACGAMGLTLSMATDVALPWMGVAVPGLGSLSLILVGSLMVFNLQRYGYILLSPAAFSQEILESLRDGVALLNSDGRIRSVNKALEELAGVAPSALDRKLAIELMPELRRRHSEEACTQAVQLQRADGESIAVEVTSLALRTSRGFLLGEALVIRDQREVLELRRRLSTAGRLATVGELSAGISHEISEPVGSVLANLDLLRVEWDRATSAMRGPALAGLHKTIAEGEEMIDECVEGVERVAEVVREVQSFSRLDPKERVHVDVRLLAERVLRLASPRVSAGVSLQHRLSPVPDVWCAPKKLERVILNLLLNAVHAVEGDGTVHLTTEAEGSTVRIRVDDDGCGISPSDQERIFDPFFTTKPLGEGTGLGLSISYHLVRSHGGEIRVESRVGEGTSFTIELPVSRA